MTVMSVATVKSGFVGTGNYVADRLQKADAALSLLESDLTVLLENLDEMTMSQVKTFLKASLRRAEMAEN